MKILLDENLPEALIVPLRSLGHIVESVGSLKLKGLDNGRLYREIAVAYDLFFTKDREFADQVGVHRTTAPVKIVVTVIRQQPAPSFVRAFLEAFASTEWTAVPVVSEWPMPQP